MPTRWERELRTIKNVPAPLERIRDRAARGPERLPAHDLPLRRQRVAAGVVAAAVFLAAGAFALRAWRSDPKAADAGTSSPPAWLIEEARTMASQNQDPSPTSARWVLTDARTAAPAVGLTPDQTSGQAEYLVVLEGHFVGVGAKIPSGAEVPTGTTLVFTLNPADHQVLDWGVGDETVDVPGLVPFELGEADVGRQPATGLLIGDETRIEGWVTLASASGVWVAGGGQLFEVDPLTGASRRVATGGWDYDYVGLSDAGEGTILLTSGSTLLELDGRSGTVIQRLDLGSLGYLNDVLQSPSGTWVTASSRDGGEVLAQIDLDTGAVLQRFDVGRGELVEAAGYLFMTSEGSGLVRVDPGSGDMTTVPGVAGGAAAAVGSHVWITSGAAVTCVDAVELTSCGDVSVARPGLVSADGTHLWVLSLTGSRSSRIYVPDPDQPASVTLIDGATGETLAGPLALPDSTPASLSAFDGHAWVGFHDTGRIVRVDMCTAPCGS
jgi:hypothetical protein